MLSVNSLLGIAGPAPGNVWERLYSGIGQHPYIRTTGLLVVLTAVFVCVWLIWAPGQELQLASYVTLHAFLETCSIIVCVLVLVVARAAMGNQRNRNMALLGVAFFGVALLDFMHTHSYLGMPALVTPSSPGKAINFWLAARLLAASALLAAAFLSWERVVPAKQMDRWIGGMLLAAALVTWVFLYRPEWVPQTFIPGQGLTPFKIGAEYVVIALSLIAAVGYYQLSTRPRSTGSSTPGFDPIALLAATIVTAMAGIFFTIYTDVDGLFNVLGHTYKVIGAWFLYRGLVATNLFEVETRARLALDAAQLGSWSWDVSTDQIEWDETGVASWGLPKGARSTMSAVDALIHPDDRAAKQGALRLALDPDGNGTYSAEYRILRSGDGSIYHVASRGKTAFRNGKPHRVIGVIRDVTERRLAENAVRRSEARLSDILSIAADAIISIDERQCITLFNQGAEKIFGYSSSEVIGEPLATLLPERFRSGHAGHVRQFAASQGTARLMGERREIFGLRKDGIEFPAEASISKIGTEGGRTFTVVLRDITERVLREQALLASEQRLARFVEQAPVPIAMFDPDMRYVAVSSRWLATFSPSQRDVIGRSHYEVIPDIPERWKEIHRRGLAGETLTADADPFPRADGGTMWVRWEVRPWQHRDGRIGGIMIFADDESIRVESEQARRQSEERLSLALQAGNIGWFEQDYDRSVHYWSPIYRQILGVGPDEPASVDRVAALVPAEERRAFELFIERVRDPNVTDQLALEHRIIRSDGSERWLARDLTRHFEGEGASRRLARTVGVVRDITEKKKFEERLEQLVGERTAELSALVDALPDGIVQADIARNILAPNAAMLRLFGYDRDDLVGMFAGKLYASPADNDTVTTAWVAWESGKQLEPVTVECRRKNGSTFTALVLGNVVRDSAGGIVSRVGVVRDITDEMKRQKALTQAQRMEAFGQLTGGIAHDFNNLLTVITGNQELLEMRLKDDKELDLLKRAQEAADMGARLTRRLLTFARNRPLARTSLNLNDEIGKMTELLRRSIGEQVMLTTNLAPRLGTVQADASEIENAILNLAINARDAMPNGGSIAIETEVFNVEPGDSPDHKLRPGNYIRLSVSDTGTGMPPEVRDRVFEPFFTTKQPGKGTGLGLSTIYGFVQQLGGTVTIYSEAGRGTTVNLYLPSVTESGQVQPDERRRDEIPGGAGKTVLLVEDNPDVRDVSRKRLEELGYTVLEVENGPMAIGQLKAAGNSIQAVFSDVVMPGGCPDMISRNGSQPMHPQSESC